MWNIKGVNFIVSKLSLLLTFISSMNNVFKKCWRKKEENCGRKAEYNGSYDEGVNE